MKQSFTDRCLECGFNVNLSPEECLEYLKTEVESLRARKDPVVEEIRKYENRLGIGDYG